jgi:hypothetical protein
MREFPKLAQVRVIPWDGQWGIALEFEGGRHIAHAVGDREAAEQQVELARMSPGYAASLLEAPPRI